MDGGHAFPHQDAGSSQYRDEFARTGLQSEASDENSGDWDSDGGDAGLTGAFCLISRLVPQIASAARNGNSLPTPRTRQLLNAFLHGLGRIATFIVSVHSP